MWDEIEQLQATIDDLSLNKRICTGQPFDTLDTTNLPRVVDSEEGFRALVSEFYKLWHEKWRIDVGFLLTSGKSAAGQAKHFGWVLKQIRTAHQHSTDRGAVRALMDWQYQTCGKYVLSAPEEWAKCASELIVQLRGAVSDLTTIADGLRHHESDRLAWQTRVNESVGSAVIRVATDLGLRLTPRNIDYHKRQVEGRWQMHKVPAGTDARLALDSLVERQLLSLADELPCSYLDILQELNVVGSRRALAAIQLAHAVAAISRTRGEAFLKLVATTWSTLQPLKPSR